MATNIIPHFNDVQCTNGSHMRVMIDCDFQIAEKCPKTFARTYKDIITVMNKNEGKYICMHCSRALKISGRLNPSVVHRTLDDSMMKNIDTEGKAYLLGWIASDGHVKKRVTHCTMQYEKKRENKKKHFKS